MAEMNLSAVVPRGGGGAGKSPLTSGKGVLISGNFHKTNFFEDNNQLF